VSAEAHVYCALLHHPVRDRAGATVTTAVTNLDVHDIARSARTYGVRRYYVVTPIEAQHVLVQRIIEHWTTGAGRKRIPERHVALALCESLATLEQAIADVQRREGARPTLLATAARPTVTRPLTRFAAAREQLRTGGPYLILFGTGHGLADAVLQSADVLLEPIAGAAGDYNHLSVRAAAAIVLDRLLAPDRKVPEP
jgi:hypothetical protein